MLTLYKAITTYDAQSQFSKMKNVKVLYVLCTTDKVFPPSLAPPIMQALKEAGVQDATYYEFDSVHGHLATSVDMGWEPVMRAFMARIEEECGERVKEQ